MAKKRRSGIPRAMRLEAMADEPPKKVPAHLQKLDAPKKPPAPKAKKPARPPALKQGHIPKPTPIKPAKRKKSD